eukprot:TRINITY_DN15958_c0_g1_i1.p1 TRINITY_DN15958_c0_g1~~TRINITY_DN15958_c0_g1_i1.p1  ORF type:complete len:189 (-),score=32.86 TRINITY_DN15958_c0_g1_i1:143-709(-)
MSGRGIYVLRLEDEKFLVGYSDSVVSSIEAHFEGNGSPYTQRHRPVEVFSIKKMGKEDDVMAVSLEMARVYGFKNVQTMITKDPSVTPKKMELTSNLIQNPTITSNQIEIQAHLKEILNPKETPEPELDENMEKKLTVRLLNLMKRDRTACEPIQTEPEGITCFHCGRNTHFGEDCDETTDAWGNELF